MTNFLSMSQHSINSKKPVLTLPTISSTEQKHFILPDNIPLY